MRYKSDVVWETGVEDQPWVEGKWQEVFFAQSWALEKDDDGKGQP